MDTYALKKTARLAGVLYVIMGIAGYFTLMYVPDLLYVKNNAEATCNNIIHNEFLFRSGIAASIICGIASFYLAAVLYKLFSEIDPLQCRLLFAFIIAQVAITFTTDIFRIAALKILKEEFEIIDPQQTAITLIRMQGYGILITEVFMGLWLIPFAILVYRSGFIPRWIGVLMLLAGCGYTIDCFTFLILPSFRETTKIIAYSFSGLGELSILFWLLIIGARKPRSISLR